MMMMTLNAKKIDRGQREPLMVAIFMAVRQKVRKSAIP